MILSLCIVFIGFSGLAAAADKDDAPVSVSAGIAAPAGATAVLQNPAGLVPANGWSLELQSGVPGDPFDNPHFRGGMRYGGQGFGLAAQVSQFTGTFEQTAAEYGLGIHASGIKTSIGVAATTPISPSGGSTSFNAGALIGAGGRTRLGFAVFNLENPYALAAGVAFAMSNDFQLVVDAAASEDLDDPGLQPGIAVGSRKAMLTVSYGFALDGAAGGAPLLSDGLSVGAGLAVGSRSRLALHYEAISRYYVALSIGL